MFEKKGEIPCYIFIASVQFLGFSVSRLCSRIVTSPSVLSAHQVERQYFRQCLLSQRRTRFQLHPQPSFLSCCLSHSSRKQNFSPSQMVHRFLWMLRNQVIDRP